MSIGNGTGLPARLITFWKQLTPAKRILLIVACVGALWIMGPFALILVPVLVTQLKRRSKEPGARDLFSTLLGMAEAPSPPPPEAPPRARAEKLRQPPAPAPRKAIAPPMVAEERTAAVPAADPFAAFSTPLDPLTGLGSSPNGFDEALAMLRGEDEPKTGDRR